MAAASTSKRSAPMKRIWLIFILAIIIEFVVANDGEKREKRKTSTNERLFLYYEVSDVPASAVLFCSVSERCSK